MNFEVPAGDTLSCEESVCCVGDW